MSSTPFLPAAIAHRRPTVLGVLAAVLLPSLVHAARAVARPTPVAAPGRAATMAGTTPRCLR